MTPWSDINRFNQQGYSSPTIFPEAKNYRNLVLFMEDLALAEARQESHLDWVWEQRMEAEEEWREYQAEIKAEREELL